MKTPFLLPRWKIYVCSSNSSVPPVDKETFNILSLSSSSLQSDMLPPKTHPRNTTNVTQLSTTNSDKEILHINELKNGSSLVDIVKKLQDVFILNLEETELHCVYCYETVSELKRPGSFNFVEVEHDKLPTRSQKLRFLVKILKNHLKLGSHPVKVELSSRGESVKITKRNWEMGKQLGTLCYFLYFQKLPFSLYKSIHPWYSMNGIDMGGN